MNEQDEALNVSNIMSYLWDGTDSYFISHIISVDKNDKTT